MKPFFCQDKKINIRRQFCSHKLRLSYNAKGELVLSAPYFCSQKTLETFIHQNWEWIKAHQPTLLHFYNGQTIMLLGQNLTITHTSLSTPTCIQDGKLLVSGDISFLNRRVCDFIKKETLSFIQTQAPKKASQIGQTIHRITLKDTISRWGSCSSQHNLNFCWRLGLAPLFVLDYLIAHEVAHLKEMNHGPRFWALVSKLTPHRLEAEIWLRRHGKELR